MLPATPRRGAWIGPAAGLGVVVMAAAAYFWPVRGSETDRPAIVVLPVENTNGDPAGALDEMAARERAKVAEEISSQRAGKSTRSGAAGKPRAVHARKRSAENLIASAALPI